MRDSQAATKGPTLPRMAIAVDLHASAQGFRPIGVDRIASVIKAAHPDFRYQPISPPEEIGNGGSSPLGVGQPPQAARLRRN
jgi:hypothetical protein